MVRIIEKLDTTCTLRKCPCGGVKGLRSYPSWRQFALNVHGAPREIQKNRRGLESPLQLSCQPPATPHFPRTGMTWHPEDIRAWRQRLGLTQTQAGDSLGQAPRGKSRRIADKMTATTSFCYPICYPSLFG